MAVEDMAVEDMAPDDMAPDDMADDGAIASPDALLKAMLSPLAMGAMASAEALLMAMASSFFCGAEQAARAAAVRARAVKIRGRCIGCSSDGLRQCAVEKGYVALWRTVTGRLFFHGETF
jgi:hypothetical protein